MINGNEEKEMKCLVLIACLFLLLPSGTHLLGKGVQLTTVDSATVVVARDGLGNFTSIETAVDYLKAPAYSGRGKIVKIMPGIYPLTKSLVLTDLWTFDGEGSPTLVRAGTMQCMITNEKGVARKKSDSKNIRITIRGIVFDGNKQAYPEDWRNTIWFLNTNNVTVEDCLFLNSKGNGFVATWSSDIVVRRCTFRDNGGTAGGGIYIDRSSDCLIENCILENSIGSNIDVYFSNRVTVRYCAMSRGTRGINFDSVKDSVIAWNVISFAGKSGIGLWATDYIDSVHQEGGQETSGNTINGNKIYNNAIGYPNQYDGISLYHHPNSTSYTTKNTIVENEIYDDRPSGLKTQRYGVYVDDKHDDYNVIRSNYIWGNNQSAIYNKAANTLITDNIYGPRPPITQTSSTTQTTTKSTTNPTITSSTTNIQTTLLTMTTATSSFSSTDQGRDSIIDIAARWLRQNQTFLLLLALVLLVMASLAAIGIERSAKS
jgi:parallel beta-helix repeat protein